MINDLLHILNERGYINQCTDIGLLRKLVKGKITAYIGFDCTAPSLHVGHLIQMMLLRVLRQYGHRVIILLGGGTTKIGDPSGRDGMRNMLADEQIAANKESLANIFKQFINLNDSDCCIVDNQEWLSELGYLSFLRDYGKYFSVKRMLNFDSVRNRLERNQPLSFLEFNYMILQAYDFIELYRRYGCMLQCGGSDQWGNIVLGIDLAKKVEEVDLCGLTTPLFTNSSGVKMGKTTRSTVWLNSSMLSAYDYWQFWRNAADADVIRFLKLVTDLPLSEIARLSRLSGQELNEAKIILANSATALCHGQQAATEALATARATFCNQSIGQSLPNVVINKSDLKAGVLLSKLLGELGFCVSRGEARRLIEGKGVKLNNILVEDSTYKLQSADFQDNRAKLSVGKKKHAIIELLE